MTADPRVINTAYVIERLSFVEAMELCNFGAKVIYPPTIYPVFHKNIPIFIKNTFNPSAPGTLFPRTIRMPRGRPSRVFRLSTTRVSSLCRVWAWWVSSVLIHVYSTGWQSRVSVSFWCRRHRPKTIRHLPCAMPMPSWR